MRRVMKNDSIDQQKVALARYAAVSWISQELASGKHLKTALQEASQRQWSEHSYVASTLEEWFYAFKKHGIAGLTPRSRSDKGQLRSLSPEARERLESLRRQYPHLTVRSLVRQLLEKGVLQLGAFSYSSIYRWLDRIGLDARTLRMEASCGSAPTKAFEVPMANELWMADMMYGPVLSLADGRVLRTRLFAILDDCSRLVVSAQYYASESLACFLDVFRHGVEKRGIPWKLYTDLGKIFTCHHLAVVCANLDIRLLHAKPYAAWSKGKIEKYFRGVQEDFQQRLTFSPVKTLTELNERFWQWLESDYHQRHHSALNTSPAVRFAERSQALRTLPAGADLDALFFANALRRVRKDATISLGGKLWEVSPALRCRQIQLRYNPFTFQRIDVYLDGKLFGQARPCDKILNSRISSNDYESKF